MTTITTATNPSYDRSDETIEVPADAARTLEYQCKTRMAKLLARNASHSLHGVERDEYIDLARTVRAILEARGNNVYVPVLDFSVDDDRLWYVLGIDSNVDRGTYKTAIAYQNDDTEDDR